MDMGNLVSTSIAYIKLLDWEFEKHIEAFLKYYNLPGENAPFLISHLVLFIKLAFYMLVLIIPTAIVKIVKNDSGIVTFVFLVVVTVLGLSLLGAFMGFFQLAFV